MYNNNIYYIVYDENHDTILKTYNKNELIFYKGYTIKEYNTKQNYIIDISNTI